MVKGKNSKINADEKLRKRKIKCRKKFNHRNKIFRKEL